MLLLIAYAFRIEWSANTLENICENMLTRAQGDTLGGWHI